MKLFLPFFIVLTTLGGLTHYYMDTWGEQQPEPVKLAAAEKAETPAALRSAARLY